VSHWTDQERLRDQYRTDANLAARQSIYQYQQPHIDLVAEILAVAAVASGDTVADIGCGNGRYLAGLAARTRTAADRQAAADGANDTGHLLGVDMSPGMLATARSASGAASVNANATRLPMRDDSVDVTLAMHMLYHVPDPAQAVREFRRVTRPGGRVIVGLNGDDHLHELRTILASATEPGSGPVITPLDERFTLDRGEELVRPMFGSVTRHDFTGTIVLTDLDPLVAYVNSMTLVADQAPRIEAVIQALQVPFRITTHSGCLVCVG
jgi:ubiquinone/menaquinone biosynthesis C-methylase UbiE